MMCQRMGWPPTSTIGFGLTTVSSASRVPRPPARITTFTSEQCSFLSTRAGGGDLFELRAHGAQTLLREVAVSARPLPQDERPLVAVGAEGLHLEVEAVAPERGDELQHLDLSPDVEVRVPLAVLRDEAADLPLVLDAE